MKYDMNIMDQEGEYIFEKNREIVAGNIFCYFCLF